MKSKKAFLPGPAGGRTAASGAVFALRKTSPRHKERHRSWRMRGEKSWQDANQVMAKAHGALILMCHNSPDSYECLAETSKVMGPTAVKIVKLFRRLRD